MITPLNMAIMDRTAMIRTEPMMNTIIFSRFLLLLLSKKISPYVLLRPASDMSISRRYEFFQLN